MNCGIIIGSRRKLPFHSSNWQLLKAYSHQYFIADWTNCPNLTQAFWECLPEEEQQTKTPYHPISLRTLRHLVIEHELFMYDWEDGYWQDVRRDLRKIHFNLKRLLFWKTLLSNDIRVIFYCNGGDVT